MPGPRFRSVDDYLAAQPEAARLLLEQVRRILRQSLPAAEETISYGMPTYRLRGAVVLYFAGWKKHYSIYPAGERLVAELGDALAPYHIEKSTIRFPLHEPVPAALIESIARLRAREVAGRGTADPSPAQKSGGRRRRDTGR